MNEQTNAENKTGETAAPVMLKLDDIKKRYYAPSQLPQAGELLQQIHDAGLNPEMNFKSEEEFPANYGLLVMPLVKRQGGPGEGNKKIGVAVCAIPDLELFGESEKGKAFVRNIVSNYCAGRIQNALRPKADGTKADIIPFAIEAFLESKRGRESFKAYQDVAPIFVKALKKKGMGFMNPALLKQVLQFSEFALEKFGNIPQEVWEQIIGKMVVMTRDKFNNDPSVIEGWLATRNDATLPEVETFELDDLDLAGYDSPDDDDEDETEIETDEELSTEAAVQGDTPAIDPVQPTV